MVSSTGPESFRGLLLRLRGRTGLLQRELASRAGTSLRSIQNWEAGDKFPTAERLRGLIGALVDAGAFTNGRERTEALELWAAAERDAPRMKAPFDDNWFAALGAAQQPPASNPARTARPAERHGTVTASLTQDWGEMPSSMGFVGRTAELDLLQSWVLRENCRVLAVVGMGGIGKTSLAARLAQVVAPGFERLYWRSLRNAPPASDWLAGAISFLSDQHVVPPTSEPEQIVTLLQLLRAKRCLLVLDNSETVFEPGQRDSRFRVGMDGYARVLQTIGETVHQSCLALTSRVAPQELAVLSEGVRALELQGLGLDEAGALLADKHLAGTAEAWRTLVDRYGGNCLALRMVGETIRQVYGGDVGAFVRDAVGAQGTVFGEIRRLLDLQAERLSGVEYEVLQRLAVERDPISLEALSRSMPVATSRGAVVEAIETLRRRSLVEPADGGARFTLQSLVLEYITDRLVETVSAEIDSGEPAVLLQQPLIKAGAKEYVRQSQERLIGAPILQRLGGQRDSSDAEQPLLALLDGWRRRSPAEQGYGPGNVINLLRLLRGDLRDVDLSRVTIREAYLAGVDAQAANLTDAHLIETVLGDALYIATSARITDDRTVLAVGTSRGEIWLWRLPERTAIVGVRGHTGAVWGLAVSRDGGLVASGGPEGTVRLWEGSTGRALATLDAHEGGVWGVALSADRRLIATCGGDGLVRVWDTLTRQTLSTFKGHRGVVWGVALSADGRVLASGGGDGTMRLWSVETGRPLATMAAHEGGVWGVALSSDGELLASCGGDGLVRSWATTTRQPLATLQGHRGVVWRVALSDDGQLLVSGGDDGIVRLWETTTGRPLAAMQGHTGVIQGLTLSGDGELVASCADEGTVRLWESRTGQPVSVLHGHVGQIMDMALSADAQVLATKEADGTVQFWEARTGRFRCALNNAGASVWRVALSGDGRLAATGGVDGAARLWDSNSGQLRHTLQSHAGAVWGVALSADARLLATCGGDGSVRVWDTTSGRPVARLSGHDGVVWRVALSANGEVVASGGEDGTVRAWATSTAQPLATLRGHVGVVWRVALSADGRLVASGGEDRTVRLWDARSGRELASLSGHTSTIRGLAVSDDGRLVASCSLDGTVRLWASSSGQLLQTLQGHPAGVLSLALSANGKLLASGGFDGDVRLWDANTGARIGMIQVQRPYERMDISGLTGLTEAQHKALLALGAVERVRTERQPAHTRTEPHT